MIVFNINRFFAESEEVTSIAIDFNQPVLVDGLHFDRPWLQRYGSGRVCHVSWLTYLEPRSNSPWRGYNFRFAPEAPLFFRRMPAVPRDILEPLGASRPRPRARDHLKKGLAMKYQ